MSALSIPASIYNRLDGYLFEHIRDYAYGTPKQRYNMIIKQIADLNDIPVCGENCKFRPKLSGGTLRKYAVERRNAWCIKCGRAFDGVAYNHGIVDCVCCAQELATINFWYYHSSCNRNNGRLVI